ncbi:DUF2625 domain-containing protein [Chitinophaga qingshengii]|uniref:DUF2625 domain-containing protein n=1 Tax=Chitinophaga qingshengii TaxID=1569794 RepID=A0ABR7TG74_9BACT|nr:DUF2625 domain-containing protein [Chitinophaga qingshengii]MBC9928920.1 DUF2625 domain-containing protein [Chitinophaga qingshengii]
MHDHHYNLLGVTRLFVTNSVAKKTMEALINLEEPGWELVTSWLENATNQVVVLPVTQNKARETLYEVQVSTRSPMGAIIFSSGGILVDHGWIRILGSGHPSLDRTLHTWNLEKTIFPEEHTGFLLIADDAVGGYFAINSGGLGEDMGKVYYFDPTTLEWEPLELTYTEFLLFCFEGDIAGFYKDLRWEDWQAEVSTLNGNEVFAFYPMLWTVQGSDVNTSSRRKVPVEEHYRFTAEMSHQ